MKHKPLIRKWVYQLGFRPKPGSIFNSPALDFHYAVMNVRETYLKSVEFDYLLHDSNVDVAGRDTSNEPIRHMKNAKE